MTAAVLREAAALMRSRAEDVAATEWFCTTSDQERFGGYDVWTHDAETHWTVATSDFAPTADHIAGWHPVVALAVADWLESFARDEVWRYFESLSEPPTPDSQMGAALAVARAYLGGVS